jgi:NAD(P)-dependent dehydrogenase (short-subunit alcohol dehydrogenase family)
MTGDSTDKRVAFVTGGAKRIGRAISLRLAQAGYAVAVHCNRSTEEADSLKQEIETGGGSCMVCTADLADSGLARGLIESAGKALGPVTLLVNNASVFEEDGIATLTEEHWQRQMAINFATPVFLAQAFAARRPPAGPPSSIFSTSAC